MLTAYYIDGVPDGLRVYEQQLRVVVEPPWVWRARIGYLLHFGWLGSLRVGPAAEVIHVPNRETGVTVRAGPLVSVALTHHLEAAAAVMIVAATQDELGLAGADLGQLGLRYRWATGDRWAQFP
mgnify:CR=1 FL=1